jgi:hypothetical protein
VTVQVRATDTGGNVGLSNVINLTLTPDTTPPAVLNTSLADGAGYAPDLGPVRVSFSEPIDPATLSAGTVQLLGPTGAVVPTTFRVLRRGTLVEAQYPALPVGTYQLVVRSAAVRDRAGNALGTNDLVTTFRVGTVLFADNFDADNGGQPAQGTSSLVNWIQTRPGGSVDLDRPTRFGYSRPGLVIDLDGSFNPQPGRLETRIAFDLQPGTYTLVFWLGSNSGDFREREGETNAMTVSLGSAYSETITRVTQVPVRSEVVRRQIVVTGPESARIVFDHLGNSDAYGLVIDDVALLRLP